MNINASQNSKSTTAGTNNRSDSPNE